MTRPFPQARLLLVAVVAVALIGMCCFGAAAAVGGASGGSAGGSTSLFTLHSSPLSAGVTATGAKLRVLRTMACLHILVPAVSVRGALDASASVAPGAGAAPQLFSVRLRL